MSDQAKTNPPDQSQSNQTTGKLLLKLLRLPQNRICCDCRQPLVESHLIWASISSSTSTSTSTSNVSLHHGCFVCLECCASHRSLGTHVTRVKSVHMDSWTTAEIQSIEALGNKKTNDIFERHLQEGQWAQRIPNLHSSPMERELFVRAKYESMSFVFPIKVSEVLVD